MLTWKADYVICAAGDVKKIATTDTKLYVPVNTMQS